MLKDCKNCIDRTKGCQDRCPSLFAKKLIEDELKDKKKEERLIEDQQFRGIERSKKFREGNSSKSKIWRNVK